MKSPNKRTLIFLIAALLFNVAMPAIAGISSMHTETLLSLAFEPTTDTAHAHSDCTAEEQSLKRIPPNWPCGEQCVDHGPSHSASASLVSYLMLALNRSDKVFVLNLSDTQESPNIVPLLRPPIAF